MEEEKNKENKEGNDNEKIKEKDEDKKEELKIEQKNEEIKDDKKEENKKEDENKKEENEEKQKEEKKNNEEESKKKEEDLYKESTEPFMQIASKELINILNIPENRKCFDCDSTPANWLCVNNAIFLCSKCAGEHRGYGTIISNLKFMMLDKLNEFQINN